MRSDVASPASRELSMSGRSARGKQTVDKIFNTALPVHRSNISEKAPLQNPKEKNHHLSNAYIHTGRLGGFIKLSVQKPLVNEALTESSGRAGVDSSLQDDLWISNTSFPSFQTGKASLIPSESSKVHCDLFQPSGWYPNRALHVLFQSQILSHSCLFWLHFFLAFIFCALLLPKALRARRKHTADFDSAASGVWKGWP